MSPFQHFILSWHSQYARHHLPWRQNYDPYHILVSEMMLQQTQVERVIPKFNNFITMFPSTQTLSAAPLSEVLTAWQGLGYNRRAKYLHQIAKAVQALPDQEFPQTYLELLKLPGIGPYTAGAITAFAYNQPITMIETNIRTVFLYHFFPDQESIPDSDLIPLIEEHLYLKSPRKWYSALMDYGSFLKKQFPNPSRRSKHHTRQSKFNGSFRQTRGDILRLLSQNKMTNEQLQSHISNPEHLTEALSELLKEGMIEYTQDKLKLAS